MKTMGLSKLVLVAPKTYPHPDIDALAAGAQDLIEKIEIVETLEQAIQDCHLVLEPVPVAEPFRGHYSMFALRLKKPCRQPANNKISRLCLVVKTVDSPMKKNSLLAHNYHLTIPVNPEYGVLNVAQAIQVICYGEEWLHEQNTQQMTVVPDDHMQLKQQQSMEWDEPLVTQKQMEEFYPHLEKMLTEIKFLDPNDPRLLPLLVACSEGYN